MKESTTSSLYDFVFCIINFMTHGKKKKKKLYDSDSSKIFVSD